MHDDELEIDDATVTSLLRAQFPEWAEEPVVRVASCGTVNAIYRVGDRLAARFPLRPADPTVLRAGLEDEAQSSAELAASISVPAPVPVAIGRPGLGYPLPWSVQTWVPGTVAADADVGASRELALDLADLITSLRRVDLAGRGYARPGRGGDLRDYDAWVATCLQESVGLLDVEALAAMWRQLRELPRTSADVMSHGDLIPGNVLVERGRLVGVLDGGGFRAADPALDVMAGWHLLDDEPRAVFRAALQCDELEWARSKAWALELSLGAVWYYVESNPSMSAMGRRTLGRLLADDTA